MNINGYRIYQAGTSIRSDSRLGIGSYHVDSAIFVVAKADLSNPFALFNEAVSVELGVYLNLPIVHGIPLTGFCLKNDKNITRETPFWASMSIGEELPEADCDALVDADERIATGAIVFDAWIANDDRHSCNLTWRHASKELTLFDHGQAVCGQNGLERLRNCRGKVDCLKNHEIAKSIKSFRFFPEWIDRVCKIHNERILGAVERFASYLPDSSKTLEIAKELILRKKMLAYMLHGAIDSPNAAKLFPVAQPGLDLLSNLCPEAKASIDIEVPNDNSYDI